MIIIQSKVLKCYPLPVKVAGFLFAVAYEDDGGPSTLHPPPCFPLAPRHKSGQHLAAGIDPFL